MVYYALMLVLAHILQVFVLDCQIWVYRYQNPSNMSFPIEFRNFGPGLPGCGEAAVRPQQSALIARSTDMLDEDATDSYVGAVELVRWRCFVLFAG